MSKQEQVLILNPASEIKFRGYSLITLMIFADDGGRLCEADGRDV